MNENKVTLKPALPLLPTKSDRYLQLSSDSYSRPQSTHSKRLQAYALPLFLFLLKTNPIHRVCRYNNASLKKSLNFPTSGALIMLK